MSLPAIAGRWASSFSLRILTAYVEEIFLAFESRSQFDTGGYKSLNSCPFTPKSIALSVKNPRLSFLPHSPSNSQLYLFIYLGLRPSGISLVVLNPCFDFSYYVVIILSDTPISFIPVSPWRYKKNWIQRCWRAKMIDFLGVQLPRSEAVLLHCVAHRASTRETSSCSSLPL